MVDRPYSINSLLPMIISTLVVVLTVAGGFWSLADPRSDLKAIRESYLTLREHEEFVARFNKDITRLENENQKSMDVFQTLLNARQSKEAAEQATIRLEQRLTDLLTEFRELRRSSVDQKQLDGRLLGFESRITAMTKQIEELDHAFRGHVERHADRSGEQITKRP